MNPSIKIEIDPHRIRHLGPEVAPTLVGGVRVKTTIYVVEEPDIVGATVSTVTTITVVANAKVELRIVE